MTTSARRPGAQPAGRRAPTARRADSADSVQRAVLTAALSSDPERARQSWERVGDESFPLATRRLLPFVHRNFLRLGLAAPERAVRAYAGSAARNADLLSAAIPALRALTAGGVDTLILKGAALALTHYDDLAVRVMGDVDVLVRRGDVDEALAILGSNGWSSNRPAETTAWHAVSLTRGTGRLDLHWHASYERRDASLDAHFWDAALPLERGGLDTRTLCPADHLALTLAHGQRWSIAPSVSWIVDGVTLLGATGFDAERLSLSADRFRWTWAVRRGLEAIRECCGEVAGWPLAAAAVTRRVGWAERVEHHYRVREPTGVLGALPNLWFAFRGAGPATRAQGFATFLARVWGVSPRELPRVLLRKAVAGFAGRRGRSASG